jgi:methyl-accepting chemotaxis protein
MSILSSLSISKRLYGVVALLGLAFAAAAVVTSIRLDDVVAKADLTAERRVPALMQMAELELNVTRMSLQVRHAILSRTPEELAATLADIGTRRKHIDEALVAYEKGLFTQAGRDRFASVPPVVADFWRVGGENIALIQAGKKEEAFAFLVDKTIPARNALLEQLSQTVRYQNESLDKDIDTIQAETAQTKFVVLGLLLASVVLLGLFSWHIASLLQRRILQARQVAEQVRDGDLATSVSDASRDELSPLLAALSEMQQSLSRVVGSVRGNAESVATASAQIAQGNQDLSGRTEQQASALQQTAATMEQLGTTVRHNADSAKQANQLAITASSVAAQGGQVVGQVVTTMQAINDSSRRINDIIGVIDGIAFQTNILALNAAVEAARAGEQGRGFAVVAAEVRNLAQRSADAAKEIKGLIGRSVEQVEQGTALVDQAGKTMTEIVGSIQRVSDIVAEISSASIEQSSGVQQVGEAVTQMDQATQQNAALVEESAAAAESLKGQAHQLVQAVAVFRLAQGGQHRPTFAH